MSEALLEVRNLKYFPVRGGLIQRRIGYIKLGLGLVAEALASRPILSNWS